MKIARKIFNFIDRYQYNELYEKESMNTQYDIKIDSKFVKKKFLPNLPRMVINIGDDKSFAIIVFLNKPHLLFNRRKNIEGIDEYLELLTKRSGIFKMYWFDDNDDVMVTDHLAYILSHLSDDIRNDELIKNAFIYVDELRLQRLEKRRKKEEMNNECYIKKFG